MSVVFRDGTRDDVTAVVALLRDDMLGHGRETNDLEAYLTAFDAMAREGANHLIVGEVKGRVVACYQITFISGLSLSASRRAQIEGVRVASDLRGEGIGERLIEDAERRARKAGCALLQFTTNGERPRAHAFYERMGFSPTHLGFKKQL